MSFPHLRATVFDIRHLQVGFHLCPHMRRKELDRISLAEEEANICCRKPECR
jgi:hypothetical protein